ncbi:MAG: chitobiase/beta-hexosaminidase C-terminal domain-containing protein [Candidatus Cloacimonetes bacterium]|nr:chitobiase/beta-hexosaminidase C-terminal domain-containing protein [Candidatus Cloacimonadota bacterium]
MLRRTITIVILLFLILLGSTSCSKKTTEPEQQQCAIPTFNPPAGTYSLGALVFLSSTTDGATIRYTINGSTPNSNSAVYSNFITLLGSTTIKAITTKSGWKDSEVAQATYTIQ